MVGWNPVNSPGDKVFMPHYLSELFYTSKRWLFGISEPSIVFSQFVSSGPVSWEFFFETYFPSLLLKLPNLVFGVEIDTLPETNIAPENRPLEKDILIGNHHF